MKKKDTEEVIEEKSENDSECINEDKDRSDEVKSDIKCIEELPGVGEKTAEKLREAGFNDLMSIAVTPASLIAEATELGSTIATKIITAARSALKMGFINGK